MTIKIYVFRQIVDCEWIDQLLMKIEFLMKQSLELTNFFEKIENRLIPYEIRNRVNLIC